MTQSQFSRRQFETKLIALRHELIGFGLLVKLHLLKHAVAKANFNPSQPRVPAGSPLGGQWTNDLIWGGERQETALQIAEVITGFTKHGINRAINRAVSPAAILDAVLNPLKVVLQDDGTFK